jgi:hypothetical protein
MWKRIVIRTRVGSLLEATAQNAEPETLQQFLSNFLSGSIPHENTAGKLRIQWQIAGLLRLDVLDVYPRA